MFVGTKSEQYFQSLLIPQTEAFSKIKTLVKSKKPNQLYTIIAKLQLPVLRSLSKRYKRFS